MPNRHQRTIADVCQTDVEGSSVGSSARIIRQQALGVALVTAIAGRCRRRIRSWSPHRRRREILRTDTTERAPIIVMSSMDDMERSIEAAHRHIHVQQQQRQQQRRPQQRQAQQVRL